MTDVDVRGYLRRLGVAAPAGAAPSPEALVELHRAHVARVPYESLEILLDRPTTLDPVESAARIIAGRGGYCFHLNGAFSLLLTALGYDVRRHRGGVHSRVEAPVGASGNHLALTVHGLPHPASPSGDWYVDVGLGDALLDPLPLRPGVYRQGPFRYTLRPSEVVPGGWRFGHDPRGGFAGMDFAPGPATEADFAEHHHRFSTAPDSPFRTVAVHRRHRLGQDSLRGRVLTRVTAGGPVHHTLGSRREWFEALDDVFGLALDDLSAAERDRLWPLACEAHRRWLHQRGEGTEVTPMVAAGPAGRSDGSLGLAT